MRPLSRCPQALFTIIGQNQRRLGSMVHTQWKAIYSWHSASEGAVSKKKGGELLKNVQVC